jgi:LysR family glycine cleavage system transcriptional activator
MRKLPPLPALRAFEATARHLSFKLAAAELGVTPTAISHQVRLLEDTLGTQLFIRHTRRIELTAAGAQLYPACTDALDMMADAVRMVRPDRQRKSVTLSATSSFMMQWLMPRLSGFEADNPGIDLRLHASEQVMPLGTGIADIAVRYGYTDQPGTCSTLLFEDRFAPLCSPALVGTVASNFANAPLIATRWRKTDSKSPTWERWFAQSGTKPPSLGTALTVNDDIHAAQAAIAGRGVALLSVQLMRGEIAEGLLARPCGPELEGHAHHAVWPEKARNREDIEAVQRWLVAATAPLREAD